MCLYSWSSMSMLMACFCAFAWPILSIASARSSIRPAWDYTVSSSLVSSQASFCFWTLVACAFFLLSLLSFSGMPSANFKTTVLDSSRLLEYFDLLVLKVVGPMLFNQVIVSLSSTLVFGSSWAARLFLDLVIQDPCSLFRKFGIFIHILVQIDNNGQLSKRCKVVIIIIVSTRDIEIWNLVFAQRYEGLPNLRWSNIGEPNERYYCEDRRYIWTLRGRKYIWEDNREYKREANLE